MNRDFEYLKTRLQSSRDRLIKIEELNNIFMNNNNHLGDINIPHDLNIYFDEYMNYILNTDEFNILMGNAIILYNAFERKSAYSIEDIKKSAKIISNIMKTGNPYDSNDRVPIIFKYIGLVFKFNINDINRYSPITIFFDPGMYYLVEYYIPNAGNHDIKELSKDNSIKILIDNFIGKYMKINKGKPKFILKEPDEIMLNLIDTLLDMCLMGITIHVVNPTNGIKINCSLFRMSYDVLLYKIGNIYNFLLSKYNSNNLPDNVGKIHKNISSNVPNTDEKRMNYIKKDLRKYLQDKYTINFKGKRINVLYFFFGFVKFDENNFGLFVGPKGGIFHFGRDGRRHYLRK